MATRTKAMPVGSSQWVQNERDQASDFVNQDVEEFSYSVRNELEWLNEHMADIFSKTQVNFADMFKTPGKLRGKTPRTARKVNALAPRQPLTDIFAPNAQPAVISPAKSTKFLEKVAQFQPLADDENAPPQNRPAGRGTSPQRVGKPYPYTDSGYHGMMTEDEMEVDEQGTENVASSSHIAAQISKVPVRDDQQPAQRTYERNGDDHVISDDSFVSAREQESSAVNGADEEMDDAPASTQPYTREEEADLVSEALQNEDVVQVYEDEPMEEQVVEAVESQPEQAQVAVLQEQDADMDVDAAEEQSDTSSPEKPLNRKSSFTFSSLPAREPLTSKRSMGQAELHRNSVFNKSIGARQTENQNPEDGLEKPNEPRTQSKSTAQLLHDRINMLGKTKEPRPSKSIHQMASLSQSAYPQLPAAEEEVAQPVQPVEFDFPSKVAESAAAPLDDDEDDWIAPQKSAHTLQHKPSEGGLQPTAAKLASPRPAMHTKSISTTDIPSPSRPDMGDSRHQKAISVSHPNLAEILGSTTPHGSPSRKANDGPLSASKSRLWSALKSAKSIFASSASTSAAAKLEAHNNSPALPRSPTRDTVDQSHKVFNMPGALWSTKDVLQSPARNNSVTSFSPTRKTRQSNESEKKREKELKAQEKAAADLEKAREKERQKAAEQQAKVAAKAAKAAKAEAEKVEKERQQAAKAAANAPRPQSADSEKASENEMAPPPPKTSMLPAGKLRAPGRLMRPTKESAQSRPVAVRMPSQAQRPGQPSSSFNKSQHETLASSTSSHAAPRAGSAMGHRPGTAGGNARVKALESAARKKEADEKAAAKKAEQKRELERKRAEKVEQEKRAEEERKAAEQQRIQEAKQATERKAADKRAADMRKREQDRAEQQKREQDRLEHQQREQERLEQQRRDIERLRQEEDARKAKEAHDLAEAIRRERSQQSQQHRGDLPGTLRQLSKNTVPSTNAAKPPKRQFPMEEDDHPQQPQRPGILRNAPSYQQADAKRRRTDEEQEEHHPRTSVMAPPKRPSTMRKETLSKFSGYAHAPPPAAHHASMFKSTVTAQHQMQHGSSKPMHPSQLVQTSSARIPFAETAKTPGQASHSQYQSGYEASKFKTPSRPQQAPKSAKSTPQYPQGDNIELPDIATDSEDEEDDDDEPGGFRAPSWTASPALRALLTEQQLLDPEAVFGPIGELKMEEVFKGGKNQDRIKRFRDRGSSAMWVETGDAVTSAEKRRDMELRERVVREGGWRYEPGV